MAILEQYRKFVKHILTEHAQIATTTDTVKAHLYLFHLQQCSRQLPC